MKMLEPRRLSAVICLVLAAATLGVYSPIVLHDFLNYDDPDYITGNSHVNGGLTWSGIAWAFTSDYAANWHPLTWISHMVDCQLFGLNPAGHHLMNVLFHTANTLLLFLLLNNLTGAIWRSAFVAALFAWHPLHVESVAWASERKDVLSAFFWMLTLMAYVNYARTRSSSYKFKATVHYLLALFLFACGLMSKPMVVTLPFVLLLLDFWPLQRLTLSTLPRLLIEKIPFFGLVLASCLITLSAQHNAMWSSASLSFGFRLANTLMSYVRYFSKIFCPNDLALIYPYPHSWPLGAVVAAAAVLLALTAIFLLQSKRFPYLAVGWFWFLGTLVPVIGLVQVGVQSMADRYTYLPAIGIFILVIWGIGDLFEALSIKKAIYVLAGAAILAMCLVLTSVQLSCWKDSLAIFSHTYLVTTDNYAAEDCLGKTLHALGRPDKAEPFYEDAVRLEPGYPMAQFDLGMNLLALGNPVGASNHLATAIQLWPGDPNMQYDFGIFLWQRGNPRDAAAHLAGAIALKPDFIQARQYLKQIETNSPSIRSTP